MLPPAATGLGLPLLVTARSHSGVTLVTTVVLTVVAFVAERDDVAVIVATFTVGATFTTTMMSAEEFAARVGSVQVTDEVVTHTQPTGAETETKVVLAGMPSAKLTEVAAAGPLFVIVCV